MTIFGMAGLALGWADLESEIARLTTGRQRGLRHSEDFAVDRICAAVAKLRKQHDVAPPPPANGLQAGENIFELRAELTAAVNRLETQQSQLQDAQAQVRSAREARDELQRELAANIANGSRFNESHARRRSENLLKAHICRAKLKETEDDIAQLEAAVRRPDYISADVWGSIATKLQTELSAATTEALEERIELERLSAQCSSVERDVADHMSASLKTLGPGPAATTATSSGSCLGVGSTLVSPVSDMRLDSVRALAEHYASVSAELARGTNPTSGPRPLFDMAAAPQLFAPQRSTVGMDGVASQSLRPLISRFPVTRS